MRTVVESRAKPPC